MIARHNDTISHQPHAVIFGCASTTLLAQERTFFKECQPFGFILFRRNCESPTQVISLIESLRATCYPRDVPVLIDQEGGRVVRLSAPLWPVYPAARVLGRLGERDRQEGLRLAWVNGRLLAEMLRPLGIDVNCMPVCDLLVPGASDVIGDRALSSDPDLIADLAEQLCIGMLAGGVLPVIKHMPGHGRALSDSHHHQAIVETSKHILDQSDFLPFRRLAHMPLGMVSHVIYRAFDPIRAASISKRMINSVIREQIGFNGLLFSDDLAMGALSGTLGERVEACISSGCDVVIHGTGILTEMLDIAAFVPRLSTHAAHRWHLARQHIGRTPTALNLDQVQADFFRSLHDVRSDEEG